MSPCVGFTIRCRFSESLNLARPDVSLMPPRIGAMSKDGKSKSIRGTSMDSAISRAGQMIVCGDASATGGDQGYAGRAGASRYGQAAFSSRGVAWQTRPIVSSAKGTITSVIVGSFVDGTTECVFGFTSLSIQAIKTHVSHALLVVRASSFEILPEQHPRRSVPTIQSKTCSLPLALRDARITASRPGVHLRSPALRRQ